MRYHVCYRLIQFTASCETYHDAETILRALHAHFGGRTGYIEERPGDGERPDAPRPAPDNPATETKACPKCGKNMIRVSTGVVFLTYPAQHPMKWWCKCRHEEEAPTVRGKTEEEMRLAAWERINLPYPVIDN